MLFTNIMLVIIAGLLLNISLKLPARTKRDYVREAIERDKKARQWKEEHK